MLALIASVIGVGALIWVATRGNSDREDEEAARAYFDEHGRWPGE